ncbi:MAG: H(+)/Cl(-) exchange transporter ClcA [Candidatus Entotheonellia bacterium]
MSADFKPQVTGNQHTSAEQAFTDLQDFFQTHEQKRRLYPRAVLVGALAGILAVAFQWSLVGSEALRHRMILWAHQYPHWGWLLPMLASAVGAGLAIRLVRNIAPEAAGSGIPHLKAVVLRLRSMAWQRILPVKFVGGVLAIGSGLGLGREGPTVQMGGAVGEAVSHWLKVTPRQRQMFVSAGGGAGLAAAFNAPLAGLVFVLEEIQRDFTPHVFAAAFVVSVTADVVTRSLTTQLPVFHVPAYPTAPLVALPAFLVLGVLSGVLGVAFNRALLGILDVYARWGDWLSRLGGWPARLSAGVVGAVIGLLGWFLPIVVGSGHMMAETVLEGGIGLSIILLWFVLRFGLTMISYRCGAPGGIFTPLLVLGALIGLAVGNLTHLLLPGMVDHPEAFAVVGMAAYFAAIVRAPLTGIVLIVEMTNNYQQMLPLLVACFSAHLVADAMGDRPIYEALLDRDLRRSGTAEELQGTLVLELIVQADSPFEGKRVKELGLPPGCILVTRRQGLREAVPTANTRLEAGDRITAVVSPQASAAIPLLWDGCESAKASRRSEKSPRSPDAASQSS